MIFRIASLLFFFSFLACNNDDDIAIGGQQILQNDTSSTTGRLIVTVVDINNNPVNGVRVSLHATFEDLNIGIWIYELFNNNRGDSDFGFINIGNYYIKAEEPSGLTRNNNPGDVVQVRSQKNNTRIVVIR